MKKAQTTLEFVLISVIMAALILGLLGLWKWSADNIVARQAAYNSTRLAAGSSSPGMMNPYSTPPVGEVSLSYSDNQGCRDGLDEKRISLSLTPSEPYVAPDYSAFDAAEQAAAEAASGGCVAAKKQIDETSKHVEEQKKKKKELEDKIAGYREKRDYYGGLISALRTKIRALDDDGEMSEEDERKKKKWEEDIARYQEKYDYYQGLMSPVQTELDAVNADIAENTSSLQRMQAAYNRGCGG